MVVALREKLLKGDRNFCSKYMSEEILNMFNEEDLSNVGNIETAILAVLRTKTLDDLKKLPDLSEGVENKLYSAIRVATDLESLYNEIKVKRYPLARIRRLVLAAFLGFDNSYFMKEVPYVRVLGFKDKELVSKANKISKVPIVTKVADIKETKVFQMENIATDLYNLSLKNPLESGKEYTFKLLTEE